MATITTAEPTFVDLLRAVEGILKAQTEIVARLADQMEQARQRTAEQANDGPSLTAREFGALFGLSENTIRNYIKTGRIKAEIHGDHCYRIPRKEVDAYRSRISRRSER